MRTGHCGMGRVIYMLLRGSKKTLQPQSVGVSNWSKKKSSISCHIIFWGE